MGRTGGGERNVSDPEGNPGFEWEGAYRTEMICAAATYIPIHKKPWKQGENLDIMVPIGYNTVIVKSMHHQREKLGRDRFEEAFYEN